MPSARLNARDNVVLASWICTVLPSSFWWLGRLRRAFGARRWLGFELTHACGA